MEQHDRRTISTDPYSELEPHTDADAAKFEAWKHHVMVSLPAPRCTRSSCPSYTTDLDTQDFH